MQPNLIGRRAPICQRRGHCGPFVDRERFDAVPGWEGLGTCAVCGSTVHTEDHERQEREREQRRATAS